MIEIIDRLTYLSIKDNRPELLQKLNKLVSEKGQVSFLECNDEVANKIILEKIEKCMKQGMIVGDFRKFAEIFSDGKVEIEFSDTIRIMVAKIMEQRDTIKRNIESM